MLTDWNRLGAIQYRKWSVYDMAWGDIKLDHYQIRGAPFGGPIALVTDPRRMASQDSKQKILFFTSSGVKLAEIEWPDRIIVGMGWTDLEHFAALTENGKCSSINGFTANL